MARREPVSDEALLRAVGVGDGVALTQLYERHAGALFGYLYRWPTTAARHAIAWT